MATATQIAARFRIPLPTAYVRLSVLVEHGLVSHERIFHAEQGIYRATKQGLALSGQPQRPWRIDLSSYYHDLDLTTLCLVLEDEFGEERVRTERELRLADSLAAEPRFAIEPAPHARSRSPRRRHPDLAVERYEGERPLVVELERTAKSLPQLESILRGYVRARQIAAVRYYACSETIERRLSSSAERLRIPPGFLEIRRFEGSARGAAWAARRA